jgi:hypothetical protein
MARLLLCQCGQKLSVPDDWTGGRALCPRCKNPIIISTPPELPREAVNGNRSQSVPPSQEQHPAVSRLPSVPPPLPSRTPLPPSRRAKRILWYVVPLVASLLALLLVVILVIHNGSSRQTPLPSTADNVFGLNQTVSTTHENSIRDTDDSDFPSIKSGQSKSNQSDHLKTEVGPTVNVPPQPEMTLLAKIAPEECLFYTNFTGLTAPNAKSENQVEQLFAEESVQDLVVQLEETYTATLSERLEKEHVQSPTAEEFVAMAKMALAHPAAAYISTIKITAEGMSIVRGGLAIKLGDAVHDLEPGIKRFLNQVWPGSQSLKIGDQEWQQVKSSPDDVVVWGIHGKYLLIAVGEGEIEAMQKRAQGDVPEWLGKVYQDLRVDRVTNVAYLNVKDLAKMIVAKKGREAAESLAALGLDNVAEVRYVGGLDKFNFTGKTHVILDGPPRGILRAFTETSLSAADFARIPRNVDFAYAIKFNCMTAYQSCESAVNQIDIGGGHEIESFKQMAGAFGQESGLFDAWADMLHSLGDTWIVTSYPCESPFGLLASISIRDANKFNAAYENYMAFMERQQKASKKLMGTLADEVISGDAGKLVKAFFPEIKKQKVGGQQVYSLSSPDEAAAFFTIPKVSWCATDKEMIFALSFEGIRAYLTQSAGGESLAEVPVIAGALQELAPYSISYINLPTICDRIYGQLPMISQMYAMFAQSPQGMSGLPGGQLPQDGNTFDLSSLPPVEAIRKHLAPQISVTYRTPTGIMHVTQTRLPGLFASPILPIIAAVVLPFVQAEGEIMQPLLQMQASLGSGFQNRSAVPRNRVGKAAKRQILGKSPVSSEKLKEVRQALVGRTFTGQSDGVQEYAFLGVDDNGAGNGKWTKDKIHTASLVFHIVQREGVIKIDITLTGISSKWTLKETYHFDGHNLFCETYLPSRKILTPNINAKTTDFKEGDPNNVPGHQRHLNHDYQKILDEYYLASKDPDHPKIWVNLNRGTGGWQHNDVHKEGVLSHVRAISDDTVAFDWKQPWHGNAIWKGMGTITFKSDGTMELVNTMGSRSWKHYLKISGRKAIDTLNADLYDLHTCLARAIAP